MSENLAFKYPSQELSGSKTVTVGVWASKPASKIHWESSLKYFHTKEEILEASREAESFEKAETSGVKTNFSRPGKEVERLSISLILSYSIEWSEEATKTLLLHKRFWRIVEVIEQERQARDGVGL